MFYNYKNCIFTLSGYDILATDVNLSIETKNTPIYREETKKNSYVYSQEDVAESKFNVSYYLTGKDFVKEYLLGSNSDLPITGGFCGLSFGSGFITSYGIKAQPDSLIKADLEITVLDPLKGSFSPTTPINKTNFTPLNFVNVYFSGNLTGLSFDSNTNDVTNFEYQIQRELTKYIREGYQAFTGDSRGYIGKRSQTLSFELDSVDFTLPNSGISAGMTFVTRDSNNSIIYDTFTLSGILTSKKATIQSQGYLKTSFYFKQDSSHLKPVITDFTPRYVVPGAAVTINGLNFINVKNIYFGHTKTSSFSLPNSTTIIATVPTNVKGPTLISVETDESYLSTVINFRPSITGSSISLPQFFIGL